MSPCLNYLKFLLLSRTCTANRSREYRIDCRAPGFNLLADPAMCSNKISIETQYTQVSCLILPRAETWHLMIGKFHLVLEIWYQAILHQSETEGKGLVVLSEEHRQPQRDIRLPVSHCFCIINVLVTVSSPLSSIWSWKQPKEIRIVNSESCLNHDIMNHIIMKHDIMDHIIVNHDIMNHEIWIVTSGSCLIIVFAGLRDAQNEIKLGRGAWFDIIISTTQSITDHGLCRSQ